MHIDCILGCYFSIMKRTKDYKEGIRKGKVGVVRKDQVLQGFFDGRFVQRSVKSKKLYNRKNKHKNTGE